MITYLAPCHGYLNDCLIVYPDRFDHLPHRLPLNSVPIDHQSLKFLVVLYIGRYLNDATSLDTAVTNTQPPYLGAFASKDCLGQRQSPPVP